jgi:hypothetical protein
VPKKKATGMSRRESFLDRAVIAENKAIMSFNQKMEDEARGIVRSPGGSERRTSPGGRPGREPASSRANRTSPAAVGADRRPARPPARPPRPTVAQETQDRLRQAVVAAAGESGLDRAGLLVVDQLVEHGRFDRATDAGWTLAAGERAAERAPAEWELLRSVWRAIRLALLEIWAESHPTLVATLERERKEAARAAKPRRRPDVRRPRKAGAGRGQGPAGGKATTAGPSRPVPGPPRARPDGGRQEGPASDEAPAAVVAPVGDEARPEPGAAGAESVPTAGAEAVPAEPADAGLRWGDAWMVDVQGEDSSVVPGLDEGAGT